MQTLQSIIDKRAEAQLELNKLDEFVRIKNNERLKLLEIINGPEITKEQRFEEIISGINGVMVFDPKYPNSIVFFKDGEYLLEIEKSNIWVRWKYIWFVFENEFSMTYEQIQAFISTQMEERFKLKRLTPPESDYSDNWAMEERFKLKRLTPPACATSFTIPMEERFKLKRLTPGKK